MHPIPLRRPLNVMVSSTSEDLADHRAVASLAILDEGCHPLGMEHMGPQASPTLEACYRLVDESDVLLLLVAFRQGSVVPKDRGGNGVDSYTALEVARARERNVPVIALLASEDWPRRLCDLDPEKQAWVERFRSSIKERQPVGREFVLEERAASEAERFPVFRAQVRSALQDHLSRLARTREAPIDYSEAARRAHAAGCCVPLLGPGLYGDGPLSIPMLIAALRDVAPETSLVAASEWYEDLVGRTPFLDELAAAIEAQERTVVPPKVHDLLLAQKPPPLIVSATHDLVLERRLQREGKPFVVVAHVLRSEDGEGVGNVALFRSLTDPKAVELCPPDAISDRLRTRTGERQWVVYKILGAPGLHRLFDEERGIDTVVASEADHVVFLRLLQTRGVPTAFSRPLQKNALVFLGYALDTWNYRVLLQVLEAARIVHAAAGGSGMVGKMVNVAVRTPTSKLEELAWQHLGVNLVMEDPNEFAQTCAAP